MWMVGRGVIVCVLCAILRLLVLLVEGLIPDWMVLYENFYFISIFPNTPKKCDNFAYLDGWHRSLDNREPICNLQLGVDWKSNTNPIMIAYQLPNELSILTS